MNPTIDNKKILFLLFCTLITSSKVSLQSGKINLQVKSTSGKSTFYDHDIFSEMNKELQLTQSSQIKITTKLTFSNKTFVPEFVSFRLRHVKHQNLSSPIVAENIPQTNEWTALLDLGNPKQILPFSAHYQLQIIISDDNMAKKIRKYIAQCQIVFRVSLSQIPESQLVYKTEKKIDSDIPSPRIDPPTIFTTFTILLIILSMGLFFKGLRHLNMNMNLFPVTGKGLIINIIFVFLLVANLVILIKFYINWTFIDTMKHILILIIPTLLATNYAVTHIHKS